MTGPAPDPAVARMRLQHLLDVVESGGPLRGSAAVHVPVSVAEFEAAVAAAAPLAGPLARRALRARDRLLLARGGQVAGAPAEHWLAGMGGAIGTALAERGGGRWQQAALSESFLQAPRHLLLWRRTALAACAVAALGLGLAAYRGDAPDGGPRAAPPDPRAALLQPLDAPGEDGRFAVTVPRGAAAPGAQEVDWSGPGAAWPDAHLRRAGGTRRRGRTVHLLPVRPAGDVDVMRLLDALMGPPQPVQAPAEAWSERN